MGTLLGTPQRQQPSSCTPSCFSPPSSLSAAQPPLVLLPPLSELLPPSWSEHQLMTLLPSSTTDWEVTLPTPLLRPTPTSPPPLPHTSHLPLSGPPMLLSPSSRTSPPLDVRLLLDPREPSRRSPSPSSTRPRPTPSSRLPPPSTPQSTLFPMRLLVSRGPSNMLAMLLVLPWSRATLPMDTLLPQLPLLDTLLLLLPQLDMLVPLCTVLSFKKPIFSK